MLRIIAVLILSAFSASALADGLSYNYVQAAFQDVEIDVGGTDVDGDGFGFGGSFEVSESVHIFGSYQSADLGGGVDANQLTAGVGWSTGISGNADFVARIGYTDVEIDTGVFGSANDDGFVAEIGLRGMAGQNLELAGFISQVELDDSGGDTGVRGEAWYSFNESFALGFSMDVADDVTTYGIGGRLYFGQ